jgi:hypothetical protein
VRSLVVTAIAALAVAAPALADPALADPGSTALYPETIPGAGLSGVAGASHTIVRQLTGRGAVGGIAFTLTPARVTFGAFRSLRVTRVAFGTNAVRLRGVGLVAGRRVSFTAVGVHNARPEVDVFRIAWNHGASLGGIVTKGTVFIR